MPVFDVSFLNTKASRSGGSGYNVLVDQLSILESQLAVDGKLSTADYDYLIGQAKKLQNAPGLSSDQRSNVAVKIASYGKNKSVDKLKDTNDINRLNREVDDDLRSATVLAGNDPAKLLKIRSDSLNAKLGRLADSVNNLDEAGDDTTIHLAEYNSTVNELKDTLDALSDVQGYKPGSGKPASEFVAYVTTNSKGEISDVQFGRTGKTGYAQTNGLYGGLQVYGKVNSKENGKNIFVMGNQRFSAPDSMLPGPDGTFSSKPLVAEASQKGGSSFKYTTGTPYVDFDTNTLKSQSVVDAGGWAIGGGNTLYQKQNDGSYKKYINVKPDQYSTLGITDTNIFKVPKVIEQGISSGVGETIDAAGGINVPPPISASSLTPTPTPSMTPTSTPTPTGSSKTPSPTDRSPKDAQGLASRALSSAKSFLGGIFGR